MPTHHVPRQSMTRMIFVLPPLRRILINGGQGGNVFPACQRIVKADDLHILRDADPLSRQVRVCERSAAMKAPVELLSDRAVLRSKMEGLCPDKLGSRCTECRQCKEKHGFPAGVQKVCKSVQSPRKRKIPRGILRFLVGFWCARGNSNPWPSD